MENTVIIRNNISYVTDSKGDRLAIQFNLKSDVVREVVEDFLDILDVIDREKEPSRPFGEVHQEILEKRLIHA